MTTHELNTECQIHLELQSRTRLVDIYHQYAEEQLKFTRAKAKAYVRELLKPHRHEDRTAAEIDNFYYWYYANHMAQYFVNGFASWCRVYDRIKEYIALYQNTKKSCAVARAFLQGGLNGLQELSRQWTNEFEVFYRAQDWARKNHRTEVTAFCNEKNFKNNAAL